MGQATEGPVGSRPVRADGAAGGTQQQQPLQEGRQDGMETQDGAADATGSGEDTRPWLFFDLNGEAADRSLRANALQSRKWLNREQKQSPSQSLPRPRSPCTPFAPKPWPSSLHTQPHPPHANHNTLHPPEPAGVLVEESKYEQLAQQRGGRGGSYRGGGGRLPPRRGFRARPGVSQLLRLHTHFQLGIYTSATHYTVDRALGSISSALRQELPPDSELWGLLPEQLRARVLRHPVAAPTPASTAAPAPTAPSAGGQGNELGADAPTLRSASPAAGEGGRAGSEGPAGTAAGAVAARGPASAAGTRPYVDARPLFSRILHRDHCDPDPSWQQRPGGKAWDTIKPLGRHGLPLGRVLLCDNETRKSAPGGSAGGCGSGSTVGSAKRDGGGGPSAGAGAASCTGGEPFLRAYGASWTVGHGGCVGGLPQGGTLGNCRTPGFVTPLLAKPSCWAHIAPAAPCCTPQLHR